jgi:hypothetical protein
MNESGREGSTMFEISQPRSGKKAPAENLIPCNSLWRGDGAAERAGLENRSPGNWTASSNLAPSAIFSLAKEVSSSETGSVGLGWLNRTGGFICEVER